MSAAVVVRDAVLADAARCARIYANYVNNTAISFETEPPSAQEMAHRITRSQAAHAWLVADVAGAVVGYAYATSHRDRDAYRFACDVSVYVDENATGRGVGRLLYAALLARLEEAGYRMACAGISLPNPASEALHRSFGFVDVGVYRRIGWKQNRWHDVLWLQRPLGVAERHDGERVPDGNPRSLRVLEKSGFTVVDQDVGYAAGRGADVSELPLRRDT